jgi:hypothetical protein
VTRTRYHVTNQLIRTISCGGKMTVRQVCLRVIQFSPACHFTNASCTFIHLSRISDKNFPLCVIKHAVYRRAVEIPSVKSNCCPCHDTLKWQLLVYLIETVYDFVLVNRNTGHSREWNFRHCLLSQTKKIPTGIRVIGKGKVHRCAGTEALYRP